MGGDQQRRGRQKEREDEGGAIQTVRTGRGRKRERKRKWHAIENEYDYIQANQLT